MRVKFQKTGERRYAVIILRDNLPDLEMNPAPGFDELMPHDLLHFLVEQEFNLKNAIYGQIAAGGTAGTFHEIMSDATDKKSASRQRRKTARRGEKLLKTGLDDCAKSERATYVCLYDWLSNSTDENLRARAREMKPNFDSILSQMSEAERQTFTKEKLAQICHRMDELSQKWSALKVNQSIIIDW